VFYSKAQLEICPKMCFQGKFGDTEPVRESQSWEFPDFENGYFKKTLLKCQFDLS